MHLNRSYKEEGDIVYYGEHIADYGPTTSGFSTGPHLHLGVVKGLANDFTMLQIENGQFISDQDALYRMFANVLFGGPYRITTLYKEAGYKQKYGQNLYEHWGLDGISLAPDSYKLYWPLHVPGKIVKRTYNDMAGLYYVIQFNDDISGHHGEKEIKLMIEAGRMRGYPDGTFKPDNSITRAEYAIAEIARKKF